MTIKYSLGQSCSRSRAAAHKNQTPQFDGLLWRTEIFHGGAFARVHLQTSSRTAFSSNECCQERSGRITPCATPRFLPLPVVVFSTSNEAARSTRIKG